MRKEGKKVRKDERQRRKEDAEGRKEDEEGRKVTNEGRKGREREDSKKGGGNTGTCALTLATYGVRFCARRATI
jgi:hypothetical protein